VGPVMGWSGGWDPLWCGAGVAIGRDLEVAVVGLGWLAAVGLGGVGLG